MFQRGTYFAEESIGHVQEMIDGTRARPRHFSMNRRSAKARLQVSLRGLRNDFDRAFQDVAVDLPDLGLQFFPLLQDTTLIYWKGEQGVRCRFGPVTSLQIR